MGSNARVRTVEILLVTLSDAAFDPLLRHAEQKEGITASARTERLSPDINKISFLHHILHHSS
jgi:hypothetical protein